MSSTITIREAIDIQMGKHKKGLNGTARALGIDRAYLCRLHSGKYTNPSDEVLCKLGIERIVTYRRILP